MPYTIERRGSKFCVVKDTDSDDVIGCHDTRTGADEQLRLLYAKEPEAEVADLMDDSFGKASDPHELRW